MEKLKEVVESKEVVKSEEILSSEEFMKKLKEVMESPDEEGRKIKQLIDSLDASPLQQAQRELILFLNRLVEKKT